MTTISTCKPYSSEHVIKLFQEAHTLSLKKLGEVDETEEGPIDNFLKAAELWEKGAKEITKLSEENIPHSYELPFLISYWDYSIRDRFNFISLCYANAAKCLLSAQHLEKIKKTNCIGHSADKKIQKLFKKSLNADKLINTSKMHPYLKLRLKERSFLTFRQAGLCLQNHEKPDPEKMQRVVDKILRKSSKIEAAFGCYGYCRY